MKNQELAKIFYEMADFLEIKNIQFKPQAYRNAARIIESMTEDIEDVYKRGGRKELDKISGIGKSIAQKIEQYFQIGKIKKYEQLKKQLPFDILEITSVEGIGPKMAADFYKKLKIKNLEQLEKAIKAHKISKLEGYGEKTEKNILDGINFLKKEKGRHLLGKVLPEAREILQRLNDLQEVKKAELAGSLRRMQETIGDMDFLAISDNPEKVIHFLLPCLMLLKFTEKVRQKLW